MSNKMKAHINIHFVLLKVSKGYEVLKGVWGSNIVI